MFWIGVVMVVVPAVIALVAVYLTQGLDELFAVAKAIAALACLVSVVAGVCLILLSCFPRSQSATPPAVAESPNQ